MTLTPRQRARSLSSDPDRPLTPRHRRFIDEYLIDFNATKAAIRAGYAPHAADSQANRLLKNVRIAAVLSERQGTLSEQAGVTVQQIVEGLLAEATRFGDGTTHGARVQAWGLLGKYRGIFIDKQQQLGADGQPVNPSVTPIVNVIIEGPRTKVIDHREEGDDGDDA